MGLDDSFPPMGFRDENNDIVGFDIDVAEVAARLGVEFIGAAHLLGRRAELAARHHRLHLNGHVHHARTGRSMAMTFPPNNRDSTSSTPAPMQASTAWRRWRAKSVAVQNGSYAEELLSGDYADLAATFSEVLGFDEYLTALMDLQKTVAATRCSWTWWWATTASMAWGAMTLKAAVALTETTTQHRLPEEDIALRDKGRRAADRNEEGRHAGEDLTQWFGSDITSGACRIIPPSFPGGLRLPLPLRKETSVTIKFLTT